MVAIPEAEMIHILHVEKEVEIAASPEIAWESLLLEMTSEGQMPDGTAMPMKLEAWPGGRWYRDLGNDTGHFWGHVQVIKPMKLIEIVGPMFMSYPASSHFQYRLEPAGDITRLKLLHRAIGLIPADHREGVNKGWQYKIERVKQLAESKK
jgi:uncharacterized protein YndB with AHSA1/START domain